MKKKAVTIEASQLIGFLDQELKELPDNRKGDNKRYTVNHASSGRVFCIFYSITFFFTTSRFNEAEKLNCVWFQSWHDLFIFILTEGEEREAVNTS